MVAKMSRPSQLHPLSLSPTPPLPPAHVPQDTKRKTLPLWLREALEKMERDKQKKQEKEVKRLLREKEEAEDGGGAETRKLSWKAELERDEDTEEKDKDKGEGGGRGWRSYRYELAKAHNEVGPAIYVRYKLAEL